MTTIQTIYTLSAVSIQDSANIAPAKEQQTNSLIDTDII